MSSDKNFFGTVSNNIKKLLGKSGEADSPPALPANEEKEMRRVFETEWDTDGDKEYDVEYSFMISSDFVQMKSHAAEADLVLVYSPDNPEPEGIDMPYIFVSTGDGRVFELGEKFRETGKTEGFIQKLSEGKFRFKCLADYYGDIIYLYGGDLGKTWESCGIGVVYPKALKGTPTEKILHSALDYAVNTYEEKFTEKQSG
ncbi:MAG: hypothetical protein K2K57_04670 [Oscillospiraceae bacterium]|nr:hypothetical protein [Oscillospiraceae bacterium]